ncbi:MAG: SAM-dependent methyltransferase [Gemmatimonadetes bacterium]|nr:SAM-dependent methyltransferase [Gemmatimonadota bacterium]
MTLDELTYFQSEPGSRLLNEAREVEGHSLRKQDVLRRDFPGDRVRAALTLLDLRERAKTKFAEADRMFFDRDGLEQASGDVVANHRARRYSGYDSVADFCCGVGGDTAALACVANVCAVDIRQERVGMTRANLSARGLTARFLVANVGHLCPNFDAVFVDPSRREGGRRVVHLSDYAPPVDDRSWLGNVTGVGIKVAPGIDHGEVPADAEVEFISVGGECREAVLWFGALRTDAEVRATVLPTGESLVQTSFESVPCGAVDKYLYEPDRAVIRAHLVEQVARDIGADKLAEDVAYLTAGSHVESPFVKGYLVEEVMDFSIRRVRNYVTSNRIGRLEIKKRRFPMQPDEIRGKLKLKGSGSATLVLTRVDRGPIAVFCQPIRPH